MKGTFKRAGIGRMLLRLFQHWQLSQKQQLSLLGLPTDDPSRLRQYLCGQSLTEDRDKLERYSTLLGIHKSLRLLFPQNRDLGYRWMQQPNRAFEGQTPVETIEHHGILGIYIVCLYLDKQLAGDGQTLEGLIKTNPYSCLGLDKEDRGLPPGAATVQDSSNFLLNDTTEGTLQLLDVWMDIVRVFSSEELAREWIETYVPALGCTPVSLLTTTKGRDKVLSALKRVAQGDFGG